MEPTIAQYQEQFFFNEINKSIGSGGEVIVKHPDNKSAPETRIDEGDILTGVGITHSIDSLSRPPSLDTFRSLLAPEQPAKLAMRAFRVKSKVKNSEGFQFGFEPLSPDEYSNLMAEVSEGRVEIPADTIPEGTMIISYVDDTAAYTLSSVDGGAGANWASTARGNRQWNVGIGKDSDYWESQFKMDDVAILRKTDPWHQFGIIRFGLSMLEMSPGALDLKPLETIRLSGEPSAHDFNMMGRVVGTAGLDTPFYIGLRTEIVFNPVQ